MLSRLSVKTGCRVLLSTNSVAQNTTANKGFHYACSARNATLKSHSLLNVNRLSNHLGALSIRHDSTASGTADLLSKIPDPPMPPIEEVIVDTIIKVHPNGEATFASLDLGHYTGPGLVELMLESLHIDAHLPWWGAIALATVVARMATFPFAVMANKNATLMQNHLPEIQKIQAKMSEARQCGNSLDASIYAHQLNDFFRQKGISPLKNAGTMLIQAPVFISYFFALRKMAAIPVESLKLGGLWWFKDLTVADPYYLLPVITSLTLMLTMRVTLATNPGQGPLVRIAMQALPFVIFPFMLKFPAAVLCYWATSNFMTLIQVALLKNETVRELFSLPMVIQHSAAQSSQQKTGFIDGIKEAWTNLKIARELEDRQRVDHLQFTKAGRGTTIKTYKFDPKREHQDLSSIHAKKR